VAAINEAKRKGARLAALTAAAMALPGVHVRAAESPGANRWQLDATHLEYSESGSRMNVRVNQASAVIPVGDTFQLRANGIQDVISGASPQFNAPGPDGKPQQVLTGASVRDRRNAGDVGVMARFGDSQLTLREGWSKENDYKSTWTSLEGQYELDRKATTLSAGIAFSDDGVSNHDTPHDFHTRIKRDVFVGLTQLIGERSLARISLEYSTSNGFLADPYKLSFVQSGGLPADTRPDRRRQIAATAKYVAFLPAIDSALHATGSLSTDSWGVRSRSLELELKKELPAEWLVSAGARYYAQSSADFYAPFFQDQPGDAHSSDYRLAGFGSIAWLAGVSKQMTPNVGIQLAAERNYRRVALSWSGSGIEADDYIWTMFMVTLQARF
jgi:hypothetical protein